MTNAYATHLPILKRLGQQRPIRSVLEFGAGLYSTPLFLSREHYPVMERLVSVEPDADWRRKTREACGNDKRLRLVPDWDGTIDADLVFVDSGHSAQERVAVIEALADGLDERTILVIHDYDNDAYREAARVLRRRARVYASETPWTAVLEAIAVTDAR